MGDRGEEGFTNNNNNNVPGFSNWCNFTESPPTCAISGLIIFTENHNFAQECCNIFVFLFSDRQFLGYA